MSAAEDAAALIAEYAPKPKPCKVRGYDKAAIVNALNERGASAHLIARILTEKYGCPLVYNTVQRHTRKQCGCE